MSLRTDLAIEEEYTNEKETETSATNRKANEISITDISVKTDGAAERLHKPKGRYITLEFPQIDKITDENALKEEIKKALCGMIKEREKGILIAGLGNPEITPDSIGPVTAKKILATRHISKEFAEKIGLAGLQTVSVTTPDVLGKTGIEAGETVAAAAKQTEPSAVIVIDALCSKSVSRLFSAVQITDTGISPGSGVKNARKEISRNLLGVPVVAVGVPTVVEADVIANELTGKQTEKQSGLIVTPKDVDFLCKKICEVLSGALNEFLQPQLEAEVIRSLAGA